MKKLILFLAALCVLITGCYSGSSNQSDEDLSGYAVNNPSQKLTPIEAKYVCMINDDSYTKEQILVKVDEKDYYGCCMGCKAKLENDPSTRFAIDPVSGNTVDKATAVIGAAPNKDVYYFESLENLQSFVSS